jgi:hypothetical protein
LNLRLLCDCDYAIFRKARENLVYQTIDFIGFLGMLVAGTRNTRSLHTLAGSFSALIESQIPKLAA